MSAGVEIAGARFELTHPDKVLFPGVGIGAGITKRALVDYYARIAAVALPHWQRRPVSMHRYPDGIDGEGFFQKQAPDYFPSWIKRFELPKEGGTVTHVIADSPATMAYLAAQGCITPHLGLARVDRPDHPDRLILDLDPSDDDFGKVRAAARLARRLLERLGAPCFVQTTGSRGLHVVVPLDRSAGFDAARRLARGLAGRLAEDNPKLLTVEQRKVKRGDRVFVDYLRNAYGQTAVAPYAVRARPQAPVATPLDWDEALGATGPRAYTLANIFRRLGQKADPWRGIDAQPAAAGTLAERLAALAKS